MAIHRARYIWQEEPIYMPYILALLAIFILPIYTIYILPYVLPYILALLAICILPYVLPYIYMAIYIAIYMAIRVGKRYLKIQGHVTHMKVRAHWGPPCLRFSEFHPQESNHI